MVPTSRENEIGCPWLWPLVEMNHHPFDVCGLLPNHIVCKKCNKTFQIWQHSVFSDEREFLVLTDEHFDLLPLLQLCGHQVEPFMENQRSRGSQSSEKSQLKSSFNSSVKASMAIAEKNIPVQATFVASQLWKIGLAESQQLHWPGVWCGKFCFACHGLASSMQHPKVMALWSCVFSKFLHVWATVKNQFSHTKGANKIRQGHPIDTDRNAEEGIKECAELLSKKIDRREKSVLRFFTVKTSFRRTTRTPKRTRDQVGEQSGSRRRHEGCCE